MYLVFQWRKAVRAGAELLFMMEAEPFAPEKQKGGNKKSPALRAD